MTLSLCIFCLSVFLHFAPGVTEAKCILVTVSVSVCPTLASFPHYCTEGMSLGGNGRGALQSCTIGRICKRRTDCVAMTTQRRTRNVSECLYSRSMAGWLLCSFNVVSQRYLRAERDDCHSDTQPVSHVIRRSVNMTTPPIPRPLPSR